MKIAVQTSHRNSASSTRAGLPIVVQGGRSRNLYVSTKRLNIALWAMVIGFVVIGARLLVLGAAEDQPRFDGRILNATLASRPVINDRNGLPMALDIQMTSLFAEPRRIIDVDEATAAIRSVLPELEGKWLKDRLNGDAGFAWVAREITPAQQAELMAKGIPGLDFLSETRRVQGDPILRASGSMNAKMCQYRRVGGCSDGTSKAGGSHADLPAWSVAICSHEPFGKTEEPLGLACGLPSATSDLRPRASRWSLIGSSALRPRRKTPAPWSGRRVIGLAGSNTGTFPGSAG